MSISARTVSHVSVVGDPVTASYQLNLNGNVYNHLNTVLETWLDSGVNSSFEVRATQTSGDAITGTFGTWMVLSISRSWSIHADAGQGGFLGTMLIEIRNASTLTVLDSASINLSVTSDSSGGG